MGDTKAVEIFANVMLGVAILILLCLGFFIPLYVVIILLVMIFVQLRMGG